MVNIIREVKMFSEAVNYLEVDLRIEFEQF